MSAKPVHPGPEPHIVAAWRDAAGMTQQEAAEVVYVTADAWRSWEDQNPGSRRARRMPLGLFELFCIKAGRIKK